ncbi:alpha/beta fold hydrolase [Amycolatopsis sp. cmx-8-4]|uniref:alpha/beta fold hydrolase n=1 Tax=Amycolatopsis sp. cmx-8-4 TaxID=2790947 RepID=UPI00397877A1
MTDTRIQPENEFAEVAAEAPAQVVHRRWVTVTAGINVSGVLWGAGPAALVLLPAPGTDARSLDRVALALGEPVVVIDPPGTGRSGGSAGTPKRAARDVVEAVASFAPRARVIAGIGAGGVIALAVALRRAELGTVVLAGTEPGDDVTALREQLPGTTITELAAPGDPGAFAAALTTVRKGN